MSKIGVYLIANTALQKLYVGASRDIDTRLSAHKTQLRNGTHICTNLQEDWDTFGENCFEFKILELSDAKNYVLLERKYIKGFASLGVNCLYNKLNVPKKEKIDTPKKQTRRTGRYGVKTK